MHKLLESSFLSSYLCSPLNLKEIAIFLSVLKQRLSIILNRWVIMRSSFTLCLIFLFKGEIVRVISFFTNRINNSFLWFTKTTSKCDLISHKEHCTAYIGNLKCISRKWNKLHSGCVQNIFTLEWFHYFPLKFGCCHVLLHCIVHSHTWLPRSQAVMVHCMLQTCWR